MNNRNNPDSDQDQEEQERLEQELREQQQRALRDQLRPAPDGRSDFDPGMDDSKDPVIINRDR